jgi:hypothetical protein
LTHAVENLYEEYLSLLKRYTPNQLSHNWEYLALAAYLSTCIHSLALVEEYFCNEVRALQYSQHALKIALASLGDSNAVTAMIAEKVEALKRINTSANSAKIIADVA